MESRIQGFSSKCNKTGNDGQKGAPPANAEIQTYARPSPHLSLRRMSLLKTQQCNFSFPHFNFPHISYPFHICSSRVRPSRIHPFHIRTCVCPPSKAFTTRQFFVNIAPLTQAVSLLFSAVDKTYQRALRTGALRIMTATNRACFQGLVVIRNLAALPHKDSSDYKKGWVAMCCFGDFTGGELVIPVLKMMFKFQPGDVIFFRSTILEHYVLQSWKDKDSSIPHIPRSH